MNVVIAALAEAVGQYAGGRYEKYIEDDNGLYILESGTIKEIEVRQVGDLNDYYALWVSLERTGRIPDEYPLPMYEGPVVHQAIGVGRGIIVLGGSGYLVLTTADRYSADEARRRS